MSQACIYGGVGAKSAYLAEAERMAQAARRSKEPGPYQPGRLQSHVQRLRHVVRRLGRLHGRLSRVAPGS